MTSDYEQYLLSEWTAFEADSDRGRATSEAVAGRRIARVLDVGCGAGQELRPFVAGEGVLAVGIDVAPEVGRIGRELYARYMPGRSPVFLRCASEALPFGSESFDAVICRLALPYTDNARTLAEIARVLRPGGVLLLKIHHARFYLSEMVRALRARRLLGAVHDVRVLTAGAVYHVTGSQRRNRILGPETFQTLALLRRELARRGLAIERALPDTNPATPSLLIVKEPRAGSPVPAAPAPEVTGAQKAAGCLRWLPAYGWQRAVRRPGRGRVHLIFAVADHFEPAIVPEAPGCYAGRDEQERRLERWCRDYPRVMGPWRDDDGRPFRHTYFWPAEQYDRGLIERLAEHCHAGWGEVEVHLHHGVDAPDTAANTRRTLIAFRDALAEHGCLSRWAGTGMPRYAFVHGNWALANSAANRCCGVDDEMQILAETGCYADFTLPSAPDVAQVAKINALYECALPLDRRAPHRRGRDLRLGRAPETFPLIIQGPLGWSGARRVRGIPRPQIENGALTGAYPPALPRLRLWRQAAITVRGRPDWVFIKLHCHGMDPRDEAAMLGAPRQEFLRALVEEAREGGRCALHFTTAREMTNIILAACDGREGTPGEYRDYRLQLIAEERNAAVQAFGREGVQVFRCSGVQVFGRAGVQGEPDPPALQRDGLAPEHLNT